MDYIRVPMYLLIPSKNKSLLLLVLLLDSELLMRKDLIRSMNRQQHPKPE
jgi:hypothetical protein